MRLADPLGASAADYPNGVAVEYRDLRLSYRRLRADAESMAWALHQRGVRAGDVVGIYVMQALTHWVAVLALMRLGAVSVSLTGRHGTEIEALPQLSRIVTVAGARVDPPRAVGLIEMDRDWLSPPGDRGALPDAAEAAQHTGRIFFTSGTSGRPKAVCLDSGVLQQRLSGTAGRSRIHARSKLWCGLGPDAAYGFTATLAAWMAGATVCVSGAREGLYDDLARLAVNLVIASPAALQTVLHSAGEKSAFRVDGPIIVAGGRLTAAFRDTLLNKLGSEIFVAYGSSETGGVTLTEANAIDQHPGSVGRIFPDVAVQIVDKSDRPVAGGDAGFIRIRTDNAAAGYVNNPAASADHFKDGWFYPGDLGRLSSAGELTLLGRPPDTLNIGGVKFAAGEIDAAACAHAGIADACAVALPTEVGGVRLAVAAVGESGSLKGLMGHLRAAIPSLPAFTIVPVSAIPRSAMGKLDRGAFGDVLARRMKSPGSQADSDGFVIVS